MGAARMIILLAVAVVAAGLFALLAYRIAGHKPATAPAVAAAPVKQTTQVLVAKRDLPVGTQLANGDLAWQSWPADSVNSAFITDGRLETPAATATADLANKAQEAAAAVSDNGPMQSMYGAIVRQPILANEPITPGKVVRGGQGGYMAVVLNPGMRGVAVPLKPETAAGGFILPGDHVDVLQSRPADTSGGGKPGFTASTLMRNVRVLAIDQTSVPPKGGEAVVGSSATLEIPDADVEVLVRAKAQGEVVLALRSYTDAAGRAARGVSADDAGEVHIFRNGQASDVMVAP